LCFPFGCSRSSFWIQFFIGEEDGVWVVWKKEVDVADLYFCSSFAWTVVFLSFRRVLDFDVADRSLRGKEDGVWSRGWM
jgi:hypothetical protein